MKKTDKPKIKITGSAKAVPVPPKKTFKPGSMVTSSKNVTVPAAKKASTSYSPKPMSAAAKAKAKVAGRTAQDKTGKQSPASKAYMLKVLRESSNPDKPKRTAKAGSSVVSKVGKALAKTPAGKVVKRVKTVAREVRDIPTAAANIYESRSIPQGGVAKFAKKDLKTQIKEVGTAIKSGKKGTEAAKQTGMTRKELKGRVGGGGLDYYISKPKKPRK